MVAFLSDEGHLQLDSLQVLYVLPLEQFLPSTQLKLRELWTPVHQDLPCRRELDIFPYFSQKLMASLQCPPKRGKISPKVLFVSEDLRMDQITEMIITDGSIEIPQTRSLFGLEENQVELVPLLAEDDPVVLQPGHHVPQRHLPLLVQLRDLVDKDDLPPDNVEYLSPVEVIRDRLQLLLSLTSKLIIKYFQYFLP